MGKLLALSVALLAVLLALGCGGSSNPMVGTWKMEFSDAVKEKMPKDQKAEIVAEFKDDKTFSVNVDLLGKKTNVAGTYELKGTELTMNQTTEDGKPSKEVQKANMADDLKSFTAPGMADMGKMVKQ